MLKAHKTPMPKLGVPSVRAPADRALWPTGRSCQHLLGCSCQDQSLRNVPCAARTASDSVKCHSVLSCCHSGRSRTKEALLRRGLLTCLPMCSRVAIGVCPIECSMYSAGAHAHRPRSMTPAVEDFFVPRCARPTERTAVWSAQHLTPSAGAPLVYGVFSG